MEKRVTIIGIGMDGDTTLTWEAEAAISVAELLIGAKRMLAPFAKAEKDMVECYQSEAIAACIRTTEAQAIAVLMSGDCGFYSGCKTLLPLLEDYEVKVISGIASPVYLANRVGKTWQDMYFVSLHGKQANIARAVASHARTFFLLGGVLGAADVCRRLCAYGLSTVQVTIGEQLAMPQERILCGMAQEFVDTQTDALSVMLVENPGYEPAVRTGLLDTAFVRGDIPMTKAEVRAVCLSQLAISPTDICYDLGCGTGSVSVEMALACGEGRVYAIDKNPDACSLTKRNLERFACDNATVLQGTLTDCMQNLEAPDVVFIGGTGGSMAEVLALVMQKNPRARLVITAVSLETVNTAMQTLDAYRIPATVTQLAVTRTKKRGAHTMLQAQNPIFIMTACKEMSDR